MPTAAPPGTEYKTLILDRVQVKAAGSSREFSGYASRWDDLDFTGDIVRRGAFAETLRQRSTRPLLWNHDGGLPIGYELDLAEDATGLKGTWRLSSTSTADDAYTLLKDGAVSGLSIGFMARETRDGPNGTREILAVDLFEISVVSIPALDSARITDVKSAVGATTMNAAQRMAARGLVTALPTAGSLGQRVVQSAEFKKMLSGGSLASEYADVRLKVAIPDISPKALVTGIATSPLLAADSLAADDTPPLLVDLLRTLPTVENVVQVAQLTSAASAAAVAEATATTGVTGTKQETGLAWLEVPAYVETISAWVPITRTLLADAAGFQGLVDGELTYATRLALEAQALTGDGVRPNLQGIVGMTGVNAITAATADPTGALAAIAEGIGQARKLGRREPTVIVMDGDTWQVLAMARQNAATGTLGGSLLGPPGLLGRPSLFGLPVLPSTEMAAGTAVVGAMSTATVYERLGATITIGTIGNMFIRNMVAVRCEIRATLGVQRPAAWSVVTGLPTS